MHTSPLLILLVQIALILVLSRVMGWLVSLVGQPQVVGEMIAGIMLGPSLLGLLAPSVFITLFPRDSVETLNILSQLGVIFFLFLIGLEFDFELVRRRGGAAMVISASSIVVPFIIGVGLTFYLYPRIFDDPKHRHFLASALFMGAAISITAFPVLARILTERNLHKTQVGAISITGAAVNDVLAWCLLAFVVAVAQYDPRRGPWAAVGVAMMAGAYVMLMFVSVRPFLERLQIYYDRQGRLTPNIVAAIFVCILMSAYATERIGIHALFGAFVMGCVMPKGSRFVREITDKLEDYTVILLLPLFFAYAGLRTDLRTIFHGHLWGYAALVVAAACIGKIGGAAAASRLCGQSWRESAAIGILMNTRGLMELIILTVGLSLGVINQQVYAIMVIMAVVTTALTTPLLQLVYPDRLFGIEKASLAAQALRRAYCVLIPVSDPASGGPLLRMAAAIAGNNPEERRLLALHLRRPTNHDAYRASVEPELQQEESSLAPLLVDARKDGLTVEPITLTSISVPDDIAAVARVRQVNLVLMGFHKPVIGHAILGGTVHSVMTHAPADVGIFVNRGLDGARRILVPYLGSAHDRLALDIASRLGRGTTGVQITVLHVVAPNRGDSAQALGAKNAADRAFTEPGQNPVLMRIVEHASPVAAILEAAKEFDLVIIGVGEEWGLESQVFGFRPQRIAQDCPVSLLIVRKHAP